MYDVCMIFLVDLFYGNKSSQKKIYIIAWGKIKRLIWKIPPTSHKNSVHNLGSDCKLLLEQDARKAYA